MKSALLIDGETILPAYAATVLRAAPADCAIRHVYGDSLRLDGWAGVPGLTVRHVAPGPDAADMAITIAAVTMIHRDWVRDVTLATGDGGFVPLITHLRENGCVVRLAAPPDAPPALYAAAHLVTLLPPRAPSVPAPVQPSAAQRVVDFLHEVLRKAPDQALPLSAIDPQVRKNLRITVSTLPGNTWRAFLSAHPDQFSLDPRGPEARVRLR